MTEPPVEPLSQEQCELLLEWAIYLQDTPGIAEARIAEDPETLGEWLQRLLREHAERGERVERLEGYGPTEVYEQKSYSKR